MAELVRYVNREEVTAELEEQGYAFDTKSSVTRLRQLLARAQRGLISYEKRHVLITCHDCKLSVLILPKFDG